MLSIMVYKSVSCELQTFRWLTYVTDPVACNILSDVRLLCYVVTFNTGPQEVL